VLALPHCHGSFVHRQIAACGGHGRSSSPCPLHISLVFTRARLYDDAVDQLDITRHDRSLNQVEFNVKKKLLPLKNPR
jgi:hypothetical protein